MRIAWIFRRDDESAADGFFGLYGLQRAQRDDATDAELEWVFAINLRRILPLALVLGIVGYFLAGFALYKWLDRSEYNQVELADILDPRQWQGIREKQGKALIEEGFQDLRENDVSTGLMRLRSGLARTPDNLEAHLVLSAYYAHFGLLDAAQRQLLRALGANEPTPEYVAYLLQLVAVSDDRDFLLTATDFLAERELYRTNAQVRESLIAARIDAHRRLGNYREARAELDAARKELARPQFGIFLEAAIEWDQQQPRAVFETLGALDWEQSPNRQQILKVLIPALREIGEVNLFASALELFRQQSAGDLDAFFFALGEWREGGLNAVYRNQVEAYIERFRGSEESLVTLAQKTAALPDAETVRRVQGMVDGPAKRIVQLYLTTALLMERQPRAARAAFDQVPGMPRAEPASPWSDPAFDFLERYLGGVLTALEATGEPSHVALTNALEARYLPPAFFLGAADMMERHKRLDLAVTALDVGRGLLPTSTTLTRAYQQTLRQWNESRPDPQRRDPALPRTRNAALAELDALLERGEAQQVLARLDAIESHAPPWIEANRRELSWRRVRAAALGEDYSFADYTAQGHLLSYPADGARLMELAEQLREEGRELMADRLMLLTTAQPEGAVPQGLPAGPISAPGTVAASVFGLESRERPQTELGAPHEEVTRLDALIEAGQYADARERLAQIEAADPVWFTYWNPRLEWRRVQLSVLDTTLQFARAHVQRYLGSDRARGRQLMQFARDLDGQGKIASAVMIAQVVKERTPGVTEAATYLVERGIEPADGS